MPTKCEHCGKEILTLEEMAQGVVLPEERKLKLKIKVNPYRDPE